MLYLFIIFLAGQSTVVFCHVLVLLVVNCHVYHIIS